MLFRFFFHYFPIFISYIRKINLHFKHITESMLTVSNEVYIPRFRLSETRGIDAAENISQSNRSRYHLKNEKK